MKMVGDQQMFQNNFPTIFPGTFPTIPTIRPYIPDTQQHNYATTVTCSVVFPFSLLIFLLVLVRRIHQRKAGVRSTVVINTNISTESVPYFIRQPVYRNQKNPVYLVPFTELPPNFDFSSPSIQVRSDFVIIENLTILTNSKREELRRPPPYNMKVYSKFKK